MDTQTKQNPTRLQYARHYARGYLKGLRARLVQKVRAFGWVHFWAQHKHAPREDGCACERTGSEEEAVA